MNTKLVLFGIALGAGVFALSGCASSNQPPIVTAQTVIIEPPSTLLRCRMITLPDNAARDLTNQEVANTIAELVRENRNCVVNMNAIRSFISETRASVQASASTEE